MKHLRIMLVDDHEIVRLGLEALLSVYPEYQVVAEARDANEAIARALQYRPDIVLMDVQLPGRSGIEATQEIMQALPETKIIVLTSYAEDDFLFEAIKAGASGYVLKQSGAEQLIAALEAAKMSGACLDTKITRRIFNRLREAEREREISGFNQLTEQEFRVLALIAEGRTNKEIARQLHLSTGTIRNYVSNVIRKLGVSNRTQAAAYAMQYHIQEHVGEPT